MILAVYAGNGYDLEIVQEGGYIFLHIYFNYWGPSVVKELRKDVTFIKNTYAKQGHDVVFALTEDEKIVKFWGMIEKCYEIKQLRDGSWIGSWLTEEI